MCDVLSQVYGEGTSATLPAAAARTTAAPQGHTGPASLAVLAATVSPLAQHLSAQDVDLLPAAPATPSATAGGRV